MRRPAFRFVPRAPARVVPASTHAPPGLARGVLAALGAVAMLASSACAPEAEPEPDLVVESRSEQPLESSDAAWLDLDAPVLAAELAAGRVSAERVTRAVLARIAALDDSGPRLSSIIEVNPDALEIARDLDRRLAERGPVGPLHGVPVALKASIDTADRMVTSAGSLALRDHHAARDADIVTRLRGAGAVIVAKANLSEWANFRSIRSTSGWSSLGGQTKNPYALDRNPCGSSSGSAVAVAARIVPLAVGTETDGSIVCPAGANGVVGIKPTLGSVSGRGIVPISLEQDVAGPLARTVAGAAMLLDVLQDSPRLELEPGHLERELTGVRFGVVRDYFGAGSDAGVEGVLARAVAALETRGAERVDPIALALPEDVGTLELQALLFEFKRAIDAYLDAARDAAGPSSSMPASLAALIEFNRRNADEVMPHFGQELFERAHATSELDVSAYREAVAGSRGIVRARLDDLFVGLEVDVLVVPANGPAWPTSYSEGDAFSLGSARIAALSGYPSIAVPAGLVGGLPIGIALIGRAGEESLLIAIAQAFERARGPLPAPTFAESLEQ